MNHKSLGLMLAGSLLGICWRADAAVLCTSKSGVGYVRVQDVCKREQQQIDPVAVGLRVPPSVLDASGRLVGVLASSPSGDPCPANVVTQQGSTSVGLAVAKSGLLSCFSSGFFHDTADCSGARYLPLAKFDLARIAQLYGSTAYYPTDPVQTRTLHSRELPGVPSAECNAKGGTALPTGGCCFPINSTVEVGPAASFDVSGFTPPFAAH